MHALLASRSFDGSTPPRSLAEEAHLSLSALFTSDERKETNKRIPGFLPCSLVSFLPSFLPPLYRSFHSVSQSVSQSVERCREILFFSEGCRRRLSNAPRCSVLIASTCLPLVGRINASGLNVIQSERKEMIEAHDDDNDEAQVSLSQKAKSSEAVIREAFRRCASNTSSGQTKQVSRCLIVGERLDGLIIDDFVIFLHVLRTFFITPKCFRLFSNQHFCPNQ